jgi:hypothetical protein
MSEGFTEQDVIDLALCPHGERRRFCDVCNKVGIWSDLCVAESEAEIEAECTKLLEEDGWRSLRTDPVSDRGRGKGFGELGMADHLYLRYWAGYRPGAVNDLTGCYDLLAECQVLWIEFKRPGEKAKKHQVEWHMKERARGSLTLIAGEDFPASVQGFKEWYANSGLMRRKV